MCVFSPCPRSLMVTKTKPNRTSSNLGHLPDLTTIYGYGMNIFKLARTIFSFLIWVKRSQGWLNIKEREQSSVVDQTSIIDRIVVFLSVHILSSTSSVKTRCNSRRA
ncbi:unnamed protein product [Ambrosiozyma monospora]|uniref:Unnamed protein product n=1 Tax=Ambrosiozyma monospora TaxID=43982 RepID=A0ACB5U7G1_AMBMO|nr:unnamed protein product [Ambrosiozyma monospora]